MSLGLHLKDHAGLGVPSFGTMVHTVGSGGDFPTLASAISALAPSGNGYDLVKADWAGTQTITATNGSPTVSGSGTSWPAVAGVTGTALRVNGLWKPAAATKYYRIKSIDSPTQFTLWENYADTTINNASTAHSGYTIQRHTLLLLPGRHAAGMQNTAMGIDITALSREAVIVNESSGTPATPFGNTYDTEFSNVSFAANAAWGDMDGFATNCLVPAGAVITHRNVRYRCANDGGVHQGGSLRLTVAAGVTTVFDGCVIQSAKTPTVQVDAGRLTPSNANTRVVFQGGTKFQVVRDVDSATANTIIYPSAVLLQSLGTYDFLGTLSEVPDELNLDPLLGNVGAISTWAANIINLHGHRGRSQNANVNGNAYALELTAGATVNVFGSDLEASGTNGTALVLSGTGATVNVRAGSRLKGSTNSVNCAAGNTVNVSGNADLIGATTGAGTINLATAT